MLYNGLIYHPIYFVALNFFDSFDHKVVVEMT
jgi:hypothetical protein